MIRLYDLREKYKVMALVFRNIMKQTIIVVAIWFKSDLITTKNVIVS